MRRPSRTRLGRRAVGGGGQLEGRSRFSLGQDVDGGDEPSQQVLDHGGGSFVEGLPQRRGDVFEVLAGRHGGGSVEAGGHVVSVVGQFLSAGGEFLDSWCAHGVGHAAGLEGAQVAVESGGGVADLGVGGSQLLLEAGSVVVELGHGDVEGLLELVEVAVGGEQCVDDAVLQVLGGNAL
ncbi:MAG: hypothetical protein M3493_13560 [Actinomycetota bacterium]|nr:hypothetical protein [Actinomycetota bacterium]